MKISQSLILQMIKKTFFIVLIQNIFFFCIFFPLYCNKKKTDSNIVNQSGDITAHNY